MSRFVSAAPWTGRDDGEGPEHARWHSAVRPAEELSSADPDEPRLEPAQIRVLGFCSDEGVRRNGGRQGAAQGPAALRRALGAAAVHGPLASGELTVADHGDVVVDGTGLEDGQAAAGQAVASALNAPGTSLTVILGGGHETAWSSYLGLRRSQLLGSVSRPLRWGVLNLDAHFDLRREDRPTSGTPFLQMARAEEEAGHAPLNYAVLGIAQPANTGVLFSRARELGVRWMTDVECAEAGASGVSAFVEEFAAEVDVLYLSVDLDVLPAAVAPGVSAPAALGVDTGLIAAAVRAAASSGKLRLLDVVELNPALDVDQRTARTAARLIDEAVRTMYSVHI